MFQTSLFFIDLERNQNELEYLRTKLNKGNELSESLEKFMKSLLNKKEEVMDEVASLSLKVNV